MENNHLRIEKKIGFLGLANTGVSSFLIAIKKKYDFEKESRKLKSNDKIQKSEIQYLNHYFLNLDFNGQRNYRDEYLNEKEKFFKEIDLFFFMFDIQAEMLFDEALNYFGEILSYLKEINKKVPIILIFNKFDLKFAEDPAILDNTMTLQDKLQPFLDFTEFRCFKTSLFDIPRLIQAYSTGLRMMYPQTEQLDHYVFNLVEKMENIITLIIFEPTGLILAEYLLDQIQLDMKKKIDSLFKMIEERITNNNTESFAMIDRIDQWTSISSHFLTFEVEGTTYYVLITFQEHNDREIMEQQLNYFKESIPKLKDLIAPFMKM